MGSQARRRHGMAKCTLAIAAFSLAVAGATALVSVAVQATTPGSVDGPRASRQCVACHGIDGDSSEPNYPKLAGQTGAYLLQQLLDFKAGRRKDPNMDMVAAGLSREDMLHLAEFFASRRRPLQASTPVAAASPMASGRASLTAATCLACHESHPTAPDRTPYIRGQHYGYLAKQLHDFKSGRRVDTGGAMAEIAAALSEADIDDIAGYLEQPPR